MHRALLVAALLWLPCPTLYEYNLGNLKAVLCVRRGARGRPHLRVCKVQGGCQPGEPGATVRAGVCRSAHPRHGVPMPGGRGRPRGALVPVRERRQRHADGAPPALSACSRRCMGVHLYTLHPRQPPDRERVSHSRPSTLRRRQDVPHVQGRYSFVGAQPAMEVVARGHSVTVIDHSTRQRTTTEEDDPMRVRERLSRLHLHAGLPACRLPAAGGSVHASRLACSPTAVVPA